MKAWFAAAAKLVAEFLVLLCFFSAAAAFAATLAMPGLVQFIEEMGREALRVFPWALAISVGLGLISFRRDRGHEVSALLSVLLIGVLLALGGVASREFLHFPERETRISPVIGRAVENGDRLVSVGELDGAIARRIVAVDFAAPFPRLLWASAATLDGNGSIRQGKNTFSLVRPPLTRQWIELPLPDGIPVPLGRSAGDGFLPALMAALAFVFLVVGLSTPALALRSPLASLAWVLVAVAGAVALEYWLSGPKLRELLGRDLAAAGFGGAVWAIAAVAEALTGVAGAAIGLIFARRAE
ncbi:MAG: hypothetical protein WCL50_18525, partial [Spirochaetota bacterium]